MRSFFQVWVLESRPRGH